MRLILYPIIVFAVTFFLQMFFIILTEIKRKNRPSEADEENGCKIKRIVKKVLIALVISLVLALVISAFFIFVIFFWSWTLE